MELAKRREQQIMLSTEVFNQVSEVLREFVASTRADFSIFCDANGHPITHAGKAGQINLSSLSALAAGDFAATMEIARLIGERDGFKFMFQEAKTGTSICAMSASIFCWRLSLKKPWPSVSSGSLPTRPSSACGTF